MSTQDRSILTVPEAQELAAFESSNMQTVVYGAVHHDGEVQEWIKRIKGHEWVKGEK